VERKTADLAREARSASDLAAEREGRRARGDAAAESGEGEGEGEGADTACGVDL